MAPEGNAASFANDLLMDMLCGFAKSKAMYLIARLGVVDKLLPEGTTRTAAELATELQADAGMLYRVLRLGAAVGLLREHAGEAFSVTPTGALLQENHPSGNKHVAITWGLPLHAHSLCHLYDSVKTGKTGFWHAYGDKDGNYFDLQIKDPVERDAFQNAMSSHTKLSQQVLKAFDFSRCRKVVDVGGNRGAMMEVILADNPSIEIGVNLDLANVVEALPAPGDPRLRHVACDFFKPLPEEAQGADAITMKMIMHDWGHDDCVLILKNCRDALAPGGKIVVLEQIVPEMVDLEPGTAPLMPFTVDLVMMAMCKGGMERTLTQWKQLFADAGLQPPQVLAQAGFACIVTEPVAA